MISDSEQRKQQWPTTSPSDQQNCSLLIRYFPAAQEPYALTGTKDTGLTNLTL